MTFAFFERMRQRCSARRAAYEADPTSFSTRKLRVSMIASWVVALPLFLASLGGFGSWPFGGHLASALFAGLIAASSFWHSKRLGFLNKGSPLRGETIAMVVFAALFFIFAIVSGSQALHTGQIIEQIETTQPNQVICLARFTTPASVAAPSVSSSMMDMRSRMGMNSKNNHGNKSNMNWSQLPENSMFEFKSDAMMSMGCVLTESANVPKNQADGLPIEFRGRVGRIIGRMLSYVPIPFYPLSQAAKGDQVYVCTPGIYDYTPGMTNYDTVDPFPVCIDSRVPLAMGTAMVKCITNGVAAVALFAFLGLHTTLAVKSPMFASSQVVLPTAVPTQEIPVIEVVSKDSKEALPPAYIVGDDVPLIKGDVKV